MIYYAQPTSIETHPFMRPFLHKSIALILSVILLAGCIPQAFDYSWRAATSAHAWTLADLRLLRLPRGVSAQDSMIAFYLRSVGSDLQIRIDWLAPQPEPRRDLYLALDTQPGGTTRLPGGGQAAIPWDQLVVLPAQGSPRVLLQDMRPDPGLLPRVILDPDNGITTVLLNREKLVGSPDQMSVQAILVDAGSGKVLEQAVFRSSEPHPAPAPLLLEFWDSLTALTPAQALRGWDGAHAGPFDARHGLHELLDAAEQNRVPIFLLDLKEPQSLSAVDYMGGIGQVQRMLQSGLLVLPDTSFGDPRSAPASLLASRLSGEQFGLGSSLVASAPAAAASASGYPYRVANLKDPAHLAWSNGQTLIPYPPRDAVSPGSLSTSPPGLPLSTRKILLETALSQDPSRLVVLGGSLPASPWADSRAAGSAFAFIAAHPWIEPLNLDTIQTFPTREEGAQAETACALGPCAPSALDPAQDASTPAGAALLDRLNSSPRNAASALAWDSFWMLTTPTSDPRLASLREGYLPQVADLLEASRWEANPYSKSSCGQQILGDPQPACILASDRFFLILRPGGAQLEFAFYRDGQQVDELVGPTSQFAVGLSDSSEWKPELGMAGDPQVVPGGFVDSGREYAPFTPSLREGAISFEDPASGTRKTYAIGAGIQVRYQIRTPADLLLSIAAAPEARFTPGWSAEIIKDHMTEHDAILGFRGAAALHVHSSASMAVTSYFDSMRLMGTLEDPNQDYPPGHFLPFPVSIIHLRSSSSFNISIKLDKTN